VDNTINVRDLEPLDEEVKHRIQTEFGLCLKLMGAYLIFVFGVPILDFVAWDFMVIRIWGGMSLTWLLTAIVAELLAVAVAGVNIYCYTADFFNSR
jgi:hypothetical protein